MKVEHLEQRGFEPTGGTCFYKNSEINEGRTGPFERGEATAKTWYGSRFDVFAVWAGGGRSMAENRTAGSRRRIRILIDRGPGAVRLSEEVRRRFYMCITNATSSTPVQAAGRPPGRFYEGTFLCPRRSQKPGEAKLFYHAFPGYRMPTGVLPNCDPPRPISKADDLQARMASCWYNRRTDAARGHTRIVWGSLKEL